MPQTKIGIIDKFFGGMTRDTKSKIVGVASNIEEIDIFSDGDSIKAEQIMTAETGIDDTEWFGHAVDASDVVYAYGKKVSTGVIRIAKVTGGGGSNPGNFATHITSADTTNLVLASSPVEYHQTTEATPNFIYFLAVATNTVKLCRLELSGGTDFTVVGTLTGLDNSNDRYWIKRLFGELFISNGRFVAHIDNAGVFTEKKFTLPLGWEAVDMVGLSDAGLLLCRSTNILSNKSMIYAWDLTSATQFDDSIEIPMGGPQWITDYKGAIFLLCAINGVAQPFQLSGSFPVKLPGMQLSNVATEASGQPISPPKGVAKKDNILYFTLYKTDKTGIYALGQLDEGKPLALILSKRFHTTSYASHKPTSLFIHGTNYYGTFVDNTTNSHCRCESANSPTRSSNAVYESIWLDGGNPFADKQLSRAYLASKPLAASTSLDLSVAKDYSASYTNVKRPDNTIFNTLNGLLGFFKPVAFANIKVWKLKVAFTSSGATSPELVALGFKYTIKDLN